MNDPHPVRFRRGRRVPVAVLPLIFLFFFGSLLFAAHFFPARYDWRRQTISTLVSPRDNPRMYRVPSCGIAVAGLLMLPFAVFLERRLRTASRRMAMAGGAAWLGGCVTLILAALIVPQHTHAVLGANRMHEFLARSSALGLGTGMLCCCWCVAKDRRRSQPSFGWKLAASWMVLTLAPILCAVLSESLLLVLRLNPAWAQVVLPAFKQSAFWHLGFWEWSGSGAVFLFLVSAALFLPDA